MKKRIISLLMALVLAFSLLPTAAFAADHADQVRVIVENTTYTAADAPWTGTLVDKWVDLKSDSTMMSCMVDALGSYPQTGAESGYISEINGLKAGAGGNYMAGWMGTLNDWFTNEGFGAFTAAKGTLKAGDEIHLMYSMNGGEDLGGSWENTDKTVKNVTFSTVTPDSGDAIAAARSAYDALTDAQKEQVTTADTLTAAEARYTDVIAIDGVEKAIDAIGEVTLTSGDAIAAARAAYDALTDSQKAEVNNYNTLLAAEARLAELEDAAARAAYAENAYQTTGDLLETLGTPNVGSVGGEWMVIGLARSGRTVPDGYYENVVKYVQENCDADERLDENRATDNARVILALTAIGKDVTNVGGHNLLAGLDEMSYVTYQGINGPIWTLIALDSHDYAPQGDVTREKLIDAILGAQLPDGGWDMMGKAADTDITAMAIQALAPYYDTNDAVKAAVDKALDALSAMQNDDGTFSTAFSGKTSESTAQVIVALTALGINPATDSRFIKNGLNAVDGLCSFYVDGGGFRHIASGDLDGMATEQSYYALAAYYRLLAGQTSLYDMSDVTITPAPVTPDQPTNPDKPSTGDRGVMLWVAALGVSGLAAAAVVGSKKREEA